jgi:hypothetical protein
MAKFKELTMEAELDIREPLVVSISDFRGTARFDVRHYFVNDAGEMAPSKKGINIPLELVPRLLDALVTAYNEASGEDLAVGPAA